MTTARVFLLGAARLKGADGEGPPLERKAAALLAYLAVEGATRRGRLTELLWPGTREAAARNNLVHLLRKLRQAAGHDVVQGAELLTLAPDVSVDLLDAHGASGQEQPARLLAFEGELLHGLEYDDLPDLGDWVLAQRERWRELRVGAYREQVTRLERDGRLNDAAREAARLLDLDPVSEDAHRRVMRLHYLRGDRPAALQAYHRCQEILRRELAVDPLPETVELARQIDAGAVRVPTLPRPADIPLAVLRPPVLVGREREWAQMEEAWARGQFIYISGEPGVGKTRLAQEFAASKGEWILLEGRPGDANQPGASSVRAFRRMHHRAGDIELDDWVRREMTRYLPELARPGDAPPPPLASSADLLRFRDAMGVFALTLSRTLTLQVVDDWQFFDDVSVQDGMSFFATAYPLGQPGGMPHVLATFRRGELSAANAGLLEQLVTHGMALHLELQPLSKDSQLALLAQVGVPDEADLRGRLARHSGGNPLFLLETVKHLIESRQLGAELPDRLLPPGKVRQVLERRLTRLSPTALHAARAAAVLQRDFTLELVAEVLNTPLLDTAGAWEELERAQIVTGARFSHDLVYEAVLAGIPDSVRELLHRASARTLARNEAPASRVAHHWQAGADHAQAAAWLRRAAEEAAAGALFPESAGFLERAASALERGGHDAEARAARAEARALAGRL